MSVLQNELNTFIKRESSVMEIQSDRKYNQKDPVPWTLPEEEHVYICMPTYPLYIYSLSANRDFPFLPLFSQCTRLFELFPHPLLVQRLTTFPSALPALAKLLN